MLNLRFRRLRRSKAKSAPNTVETVRQQTHDADELAQILGQELLANPHTNPAVRPHADRLRDHAHRQALSAEHSRTLRRLRVHDERADHAERALQTLRSAREASSPARSLLALHQARSRYMALSMAASLALSCGSAIGIAALARSLHAPAAIGYLAEVGLTGLTTTVILYRSQLTRHGGRVTGWHNAALWVLMIGPLAAGIIANAFGTGFVGVACSVGAAAFALLAHLIADTSAAALHRRAAQVTGADEAELRTIATGAERAPVPPRQAPRPFTPDELAVLGPEPDRVRAYLTHRGHELPPREIARLLLPGRHTDTPSHAASQPSGTDDTGPITKRQLNGRTSGKSTRATPRTTTGGGRQSVRQDPASQDHEPAPAARQRAGRTAASNPSDKRRTIDEWVKVAAPVLAAQEQRLGRQPTGPEFAAALTAACKRKVSASTAKNIRAAIAKSTGDASASPAASDTKETGA